MYAQSAVIDSFKEQLSSSINVCRVISKGVSQVLIQVLASTIRAVTPTRILWTDDTAPISRSSNNKLEMHRNPSSQWYRGDERQIMCRRVEWIKCCLYSRWCRQPPRWWIKWTWTKTRRPMSWAWDRHRLITHQPLIRPSPHRFPTTSTSSQISRILIYRNTMAPCRWYQIFPTWKSQRSSSTRTSISRITRTISLAREINI